MGIARALVIAWGPIVFAACSYGPEEERAGVAQVIRLGESWEAIVIVQREVIRRPTGLSTFPDGGAWRYLEREAIHYLVDARERTVTLLGRQEAPDSMWELFRVSIHGLDADGVVYLRAVGCPRGGECHPVLEKTARFRLTRAGELRAIPAFPPTSALPGNMLAREEGEERYLRLGVDGDHVTGRFEEAAPFTPLFTVLPDGVLVPAGPPPDR